MLDIETLSCPVHSAEYFYLNKTRFNIIKRNLPSDKAAGNAPVLQLLQDQLDQLRQLLL